MFNEWKIKLSFKLIVDTSLEIIFRSIKQHVGSQPIVGIKSFDISTKFECLARSRGHQVFRIKAFKKIKDVAWLLMMNQDEHRCLLIFLSNIADEVVLCHRVRWTIHKTPIWTYSIKSVTYARTLFFVIHTLSFQTVTNESWASGRLFRTPSGRVT